MSDWSEVTSMMNWLKNGPKAAIRDPRIMVPLVRAFGSGNWQTRFLSSGGQWQRLAEETVIARRNRGYPTQGNVTDLHESGQLEDLAQIRFNRWGTTQRQLMQSRVPPYQQSEGGQNRLSVVATINAGRFIATISGDRVANQYGGPIRNSELVRGRGDRIRASHLPRRTFWGIPRDRFVSATPNIVPLFMNAMGKEIRGFG